MINRSLFDLPLPLVTQHISKRRTASQALDLGCGDGHNSIFLAEQGYSVAAVDACVERTMIHERESFLFDLPDYATENNLAITTHNECLEDFMQNQPSATYDVVLATYVLFFFAADNTTLLYDIIFPQIIRVLKPGGRLICTMLRSKVHKATEIQLLPLRFLSAMKPIDRFEKFWPQGMSIVYHNPARISDRRSDSSSSNYNYCHWELVADKAGM